MGSQSVLDRRPAVRWIAPGVALATIAAVAVLRPAVADASTGLDPLTPRELLVKAQDARPVPMSGTIEQRFDLGLPDLPTSITGHPGNASLASLASGRHTWRIWYAGPQQARVALVGRSSESDIVRNGRDLWVWSSSEKSVRQYVLPEGSGGDRGWSPSDPPAAKRKANRDAMTAHGLPDPADPGAVADWALRQADATTKVETTSLDKVAGRSVYGLVMTPKQGASLISSVRLALDGETFVPLSVQVNSTKLDKPAIDVTYSDVSFDKPENSVFDFTPPPGTDVTKTDLADKAGEGATSPKADRSGHGAHGKPGTEASKQASPYRPVVSGTGWASVVAGHMPSGWKESGDADRRADGQSAQDLLRLLPEMPGGGGRVLDGTLFSVVLTDDGRYAVGAVAPDALYRALPKR